MAKTRISIVQYLNSVPLAWGLLEGPLKDDFEPVFSTPAQCAEQLASGAVDVGLIPSVEYQRIKGCRIVPGPAIASLSRVQSVLLLSLLPLFRVQTVAFDPASRSSVVLARVIFNEFYGVRPEFLGAEPDPARMLATNDAALIIGDTALRYKAANLLPDVADQKDLVRLGAEPMETFDLMERWNILTGLPFVFAFWAVRPGFDDKTIVDKLVESRELGLANLETIAERHSETMEMDKAFLLSYLRNNVYYHMDSDCVEALGVFYRMAAAAGAVKYSRGIEFL